MNLFGQELSEPYSIFTCRYFVYLWPQLSFMAFHKGKCVGTVVCKMGDHRDSKFRGYIAMLVVIKPYRGRGIATELVTRSIQVMMESGCEEGQNPEGDLNSNCSSPKFDFPNFPTQAFLLNFVGNLAYVKMVTLEAEGTNIGALALCGRLGFIRANRLFRYYLNGVDAFRLKLAAVSATRAAPLFANDG